MKVTEAYEYGLIADELMNILPGDGVCEFCGQELCVSDNLTQLYCDNPYCSSKIASRLEYMAKALDVDDWGESTCLKIVQDFNLKSPYTAFNLVKMLGKNYTGVSAFDKKVRALHTALEKEIPFWKVVQIAAIPGIDTIAFKLMNEYNSADEFYSDLERREVAMICSKLNISNDSKVLAVRVYNTLKEYEDEIRYGEHFFKIKKAAAKTLTIAITGEVFGYSSKNEYIKELNARYGDKLTIYMSNTLTKSSYALICDREESNTRKAVKAAGYGIRIFKSDEFIEHLDEVYESI